MVKPSSLSIKDIFLGLRFFSQLPSFLGNPLNYEQSRKILQERLENREEDFLRLVKSAVFNAEDSPYLMMLRWLGCEYGDLKDLVIKDGVEEALASLLKQGFYLTVDEFKGRTAVKRGKLSISIDPAKFQNPLTSAHIMVQSGGSRGGRTAIGVDLSSVKGQAVNQSLMINARGGEAWRYAFWGVPGSSAIRIMLRFAFAGYPALKWFTQIDHQAMGLHPRYHWSSRVMRWSSFLAGIPLPMPIHVPVSDPLPIIQWIEEILEKGETPHLFTFPTSAVSLSRMAIDNRASLSGVQMTLTGEPITKTRLDIILSSGAKVVTQYGSSETNGPIAYGCLSPQESDHMHLLHDLHAYIQTGNEIQIPDIPSHGIFVSSLRMQAPLILINISLGDQAVFTQRDCGCPLQSIGWKTHIHTIRSFEKLTCGGMALLDKDIIPILEKILTARFGGVPTDFQLSEEEDSTGAPRLKLLVHPRLVEIDPQAVSDVFLESIGRGSGVEHLTEKLWRDFNVIEVVRAIPKSTASGKIHHMHFEKQKKP
jgi:hypothetical protein